MNKRERSLKMYFRRFFDEKLAQNSYLVGCQQTGEAIILDPARHVESYIKAAEEEGLEIVAAAETHIHADFVSGARELAHRHNVTLYMSNEGDKDWKYHYLNDVEHQLLQAGDVFYIGKVKFDVLYTPGHTPESLSYLLTDEGSGTERPMGIFTGDFVFVGDVGRPDLLEKTSQATGTAEAGAREMFQSLQRFKELPDYLQLWPGHGAGSACGKSLGAVPTSTSGYEKLNNWALLKEDEEAFVQELIAEQPAPPKYFAVMKQVNKAGPALLNEKPLDEVNDIETLEKEINNPDVQVVDTRLETDFSERHLPGTVNIPYRKSFPNWAGWLLDYEKDILIIGSINNIDFVKQALESIGLDRLFAFASPDLIQHAENVEQYKVENPETVQEQFEKGKMEVIDVRNQDEWNAGHIPGATHIMLGYLPDRLAEVPQDKSVAVHCRTGKRSAIAASVLQKNGFKNVVNIEGGFENWEKKDLPTKE